MANKSKIIIPEMTTTVGRQKKKIFGKENSQKKFGLNHQQKNPADLRKYFYQRLRSSSCQSY